MHLDRSGLSRTKEHEKIDDSFVCDSRNSLVIVTRIRPSRTSPHLPIAHVLSLLFQSRWNFLLSLRSRRLRHALKHVHESKELEVEDILPNTCNPEASKGYSVRCFSPDAYVTYDQKRVAEMFTEKENSIYSTWLLDCSLMDLPLVSPPSSTLVSFS